MCNLLHGASLVAAKELKPALMGRAREFRHILLVGLAALQNFILKIEQSSFAIRGCALFSKHHLYTLMHKPKIFSR